MFRLLWQIKCPTGYKNQKEEMIIISGILSTLLSSNEEGMFEIVIYRN